MEEALKLEELGELLKKLEELGDEEEEDDGLPENFSVEEISAKEYKKDTEKAIIEILEEIKDNIEIIIQNPLSLEAIGAVITIKIISPELKELKSLIKAYLISLSEEKVVEKKRARNEKAKGIVYWRDPKNKEIGWDFENSEIGFYLRNIKKDGKDEEENPMMYR